MVNENYLHHWVICWGECRYRFETHWDFGTQCMTFWTIIKIHWSNCSQTALNNPFPNHTCHSSKQNSYKVVPQIDGILWYSNIALENPPFHRCFFPVNLHWSPLIVDFPACRPCCKRYQLGEARSSDIEEASSHLSRDYGNFFLILDPTGTPKKDCPGILCFINLQLKGRVNMLLSVSTKQAPAAMFAGSIIKPVNRRYIQHSPTVNTNPSWGPNIFRHTHIVRSTHRGCSEYCRFAALKTSCSKTQGSKNARQVFKYLCIYIYIYKYFISKKWAKQAAPSLRHVT